jgi:hypothetical protein
MGGSSSSSSYSETVVREPDKVRVAEIEAQKAVAVEKLKGENIVLQKRAMIEMIETNARMEELMIVAKVKGFKDITDKLMEMTKELNYLGEQRIKILETAGLDTIKQIDEHYLDFKRQINKDSDNFMLGSVPKLLGELEKFDENSSTYKLYHNQINNYTNSFIEGQTKQIEQLREQQSKMIDSNIALKESITNHINEIVENRVKQLEISIEQSDEIKALKERVIYNLGGNGLNNGLLPERKIEILEGKDGK